MLYLNKEIYNAGSQIKEFDSILVQLLENSSWKFPDKVFEDAQVIGSQINTCINESIKMKIDQTTTTPKPTVEVTTKVIPLDEIDYFAEETFLI